MGRHTHRGLAASCRPTPVLLLSASCRALGVLRLLRQNWSLPATSAMRSNSRTSGDQDHSALFAARARSSANSEPWTLTGSHRKVSEKRGAHFSSIASALFLRGAKLGNARRGPLISPDMMLPKKTEGHFGPQNQMGLSGSSGGRHQAHRAWLRWAQSSEIDQ